MERFDEQLSRVEEMCTQILHALHKQEGFILTMSNNDAALSQAVQDLTDAFTSNVTAIESEIAGLKQASQSTDDPTITDSVAKIEKIVANMRANTAAASQVITMATSSPTTGNTPSEPVATSAQPVAPSDPTTTHGDVPTAVSSSTTAQVPATATSATPAQPATTTDAPSSDSAAATTATPVSGS